MSIFNELKLQELIALLCLEGLLIEAKNLIVH